MLKAVLIFSGQPFLFNVYLKYTTFNNWKENKINLFIENSNWSIN